VIGVPAFLAIEPVAGIVTPEHFVDAFFDRVVHDARDVVFVLMRGNEVRLEVLHCDAIGLERSLDHRSDVPVVHPAGELSLHHAIPDWLEHGDARIHLATNRPEVPPHLLRQAAVIFQPLPRPAGVGVRFREQQPNVARLAIVVVEFHRCCPAVDLCPHRVFGSVQYLLAVVVAPLEHVNRVRRLE
jgi:hypothetical protein